MKITKHYIRNRVLLTVIIMFIVYLIIGLIARISSRDLLIMLLLVTVIGFFVAYSLLWLIVKYIIPHPPTLQKESGQLTASDQNTMRTLNINYELNLEDSQAFHLYSYELSPVTKPVRKTLRRVFLLGAAFEFIMAVIIRVVLGSRYLPIAIAVGVIALLTFLYYCFSPIITRRLIRGAIPRQYEQGGNKLIGKHQFSISIESVTDITDMGESTTRWNAIEWIASTDKYMFMSIRASGPYIVPRRAFADEASFKQFVEQTKAYHQAAMVQNKPNSI